MPEGLGQEHTHVEAWGVAVLARMRTALRRRRCVGVPPRSRRPIPEACVVTARQCVDATHSIRITAILYQADPLVISAADVWDYLSASHGQVMQQEADSTGNHAILLAECRSKALSK